MLEGLLVEMNPQMIISTLCSSPQLHRQILISFHHFYLIALVLRVCSFKALTPLRNPVPAADGQS